MPEGAMRFCPLHGKIESTAEGLLGEKGVLRHYQPIADWLEPFLSIRSDGRVLAQPAQVR